jgi:predicted O-methyltransferase YrrM
LQVYRDTFQKPLVLCVNNSLASLDKTIRGTVVQHILHVAGPYGLGLIGYWNGNFFSHATLNYYKRNESLFGTFDMQKINQESRVMVTTNLSTLELQTQYGGIEWYLPDQVQQRLRAYDIDVAVQPLEFVANTLPQMSCDRLAILVWFDDSSMSRTNVYYDSNDTQTFYQAIWGQETIHLGRSDLLSAQDKAELSMAQQLDKAQELHLQAFVETVKRRTRRIGGMSLSYQPRYRIVEFGCGYGGLLRRLYREGMIYMGIGCDISNQMCQEARLLNQQQGLDTDMVQIVEESSLQLSAINDSVDLVVSMDLLLHVGPDRQRSAIQEGARILRPGGWLVFADICE